MITRKRCIYRIPNIGFFSFYNTSLNLIDYCLKHGYVPSFDFSNFIYKDPNNSISPWDVFFDPLELYEDPYIIEGELELSFSNLSHWKCSSDPSYDPLFCILNSFPEDKRIRQQLNKYCSYIKIKQEFVDQAEAYVKDHFSGKKVTGVHIRHTDHWRDKLSYVKGNMAYHRLNEYIDALKAHTASDIIYIATDNQQSIQQLKFIKDLRKKLMYNDFLRAPGETCTHIGCAKYGFDPVKLGKEVLVEALILSKCDYLIGSVSNITATVLFWNPSLPFTNLAQMAE